MDRLRIPIQTHPFTCASYHPFEVQHLDHIGSLKADDKEYSYALAIIDAFSRWIARFPAQKVKILVSLSTVIDINDQYLACG